MDHVKEIFLVRHGETRYNIVPRIGHFLTSLSPLGEEADSPDHRIELTDRGREQARELGPQLKTFAPFDAYFDSGYKRTIETLDLLLEAFDESERQPSKRLSHLDLREREQGYTFNMTITEVNQYFPWYQEYEATFGPFYATPPGGESIAHVCARVHMFLNSVRRARSGHRIVIVTHGRVMLCFRYWLERLTAADIEQIFDQESIPNCGVLRYRYNPDTRRHDRIEPWDQHISENL